MEETLKIENGPKAPATFSQAEMERRVAGLRNLLEEQQLDAAFFTSMHNIAYYSDFLYCSFGRPYGLVVSDSTHSTISAKIDGGQPWRRSFGDNLVYTDWQRDNFYRAARSLLGPSKRLGVEFDHLTLEA
ncbi:aminopeptidase P family N-terminal domain-containing protein, partial [Pelagibius sp.]|uniref:aminopeptidase P family N-terminal domain-containing protein n=1 Tax=Pelagibius sp. TaxID=1931238 RepID=UPI0026394901